MIIAAGVLVLVGLGLFVAGLLTGVTALHWGCVGVCAVAAVLLVLVRRRMTAPTGAMAAAPDSPGGTPPALHAAAATQEAPPTGRHAGGSTAASSATTQGNGAAPAVQALPAVQVPLVVQVPAPTDDDGEPPVEEVEVSDLLLVVDLVADVLVVDEHPRYHLAGCPHLTGQRTIPIPLDQARTDGFTPCGACRPDATLADRVRAAGGPGGA